jgi:hypothetical protein
MKHVAIVAALVAAYLFLALSRISAGPFVYDEADYMYAAGRGFLANYLDDPSYSFAEYVRIGLNQGRDRSKSSELSQTVRRAGDVFFYRHAHGPVYFYWLAALSQWNRNEHFIRSWSVLFPVLTAVTIYCGCLWILPAPQNQIAAVLGSMLYLFSPAVIRTVEVAPHQMFVMCFIVNLMLLAKVLDTGDRRIWYAAMIGNAIAFCTMEVSFVLIAVTLICGYLERRRLAIDWKFAGTSLGLFVLSVIVLHPASITKLAFAKSYLYYAYLSVRRTAVWGDVGFIETWAERFSNSPVEWAAIIVAVFWFVRHRDLPGRRQALPFLLFGGLMLATMLRVFTVGVRYVLPFLPALLVFAAITISGQLLRWRMAPRAVAIAALALALIVNAQLYLSAHPFRPDPDEFRLMNEIRSQHLESARLLAPKDQLPTLHYYFPNAEVTGYLDELDLPPGQYDAIVRMTDPVTVRVIAK